MLRAVFCFFVALFCVANARGSVWFNEVGYWQTLARERPDLLSPANVCYAALVLKSEFRAALLGGQENPADIQRRNYTDEEKGADLLWIENQQTALVAAGGARLQLLARAGIDVRGISAADPTNVQFQRAVAGLPWAPAAYGINAFVGYRVGPAGVIADERGLDYKVFFEFASFASDFTPAIYQSFTQALARAGFRGDSKTPSDPQLPGQLRFQYNNLIVHSHSMADAQIAERVGNDIFGERIAHTSRGVDVLKKPDGTLLAGLTRGLDWHHFLCTGKFGELSAGVQSYVTTPP